MSTAPAQNRQLVRALALVPAIAVILANIIGTGVFVSDSNEVADLNEVWGTPGLLHIDRGRIIRYDLYALPKFDLPTTKGSPFHGKSAGYLALYWAAELRKCLDLVLSQ